MKNINKELTWNMDIFYKINFKTCIEIADIISLEIKKIKNPHSIYVRFKHKKYDMPLYLTQEIKPISIIRGGILVLVRWNMEANRLFLVDKITFYKHFVCID